jgi:hypothetical protein
VRNRAIGLLRDHPQPSDWRFVLSLFARDLPDPSVLREHLGGLADLGIGDVGFYNSSLAAGEAMASMRRALADVAAGPGCRESAADGEEEWWT